VSYEEQMALLQQKRRELRALEAQAERTAKSMQPITEQDERNLMELQARADEVYRAAGRIGAPAPMNFERPDTYRLRLAEGLQKNSATWKNANLANALAAGALATAESQIYAEARANGRTAGLKARELKAIPTRSASGHESTEWVGGPEAHFIRAFERPARRAVFQSAEEYSRQSQAAAMQSIARTYYRPLAQAPRASF
jgi:hypothetical protein